MNAFHFLRPDWLWALIPAAAVLALLWRRRAVAGGRDWSGTVDAHLLRHLTVGTGAASIRTVSPAAKPAATTACPVSGLYRVDSASAAARGPPKVRVVG